ncbi:EAL domain-containing protein [Cohnella lupini]|uniref:Diguanylate cyclase (GGDEF)-like protein n=1 Tax=Cohnella lupini TaxID=1294267 RepID=A0A3D9HYZ1_9BACL|nr:EAL domain-containing protein [Cohnella lupini]RED54693.1 diguanylate cyclase (GGDEF)-like protein [Cohnella lupini]
MTGWEKLVSLVQNMTVVIVFILIGNRLYPSLIHWNPSMRKLVIGLLFGAAGVLSMMMPIHAGEGSIVSIKNIITALSAWIGGPISAIVTLACVVVYRVYLGGIGMPAGVGASVSAALIGILFQYSRHADRRHSFQLVNPIAIGILILLNSLAWSWMLPEVNRSYMIKHYSVILIVMYPLASIFFHYFMNVEWKRQREFIVDDITGFPQFKPFKSSLQKLIKTRTPFVLTLIHIDGFKTISALNTMAVKNELLKQISKRITHWLPEGGSACRLEGEQFLICLVDPTKRKLPEFDSEYWNEMQTLLSSPYLVEHQLCHITISTGMKSYNGEDITIDRMLPHAYAALKHAQETGVNQTVQYHEKLTEQIRHRTLIEVYLRSALKENQLSLQYQPQYELQTGALRGFEALMRWNHPDLGCIPPSDFIPVAEETRLILPIGQWALRQACETLQRLAPSPSTLTISVNISGIQLLDEQFPTQVSNALTASGLHAERLELELTESSLLDTLDIAERQLKSLQSLGVRLALDDFGRGFSSMNYLRKLPFHLIKIDKSFIHDIGNATEHEVTGSMIQFIKQMKYGIVAEGLETYEQLTYLRKLHCDFAQGYLFGKPLQDNQLSTLINPV